MPPHPYAQARALARRVVIAQGTVALVAFLVVLPFGARSALGAGWGAAIAGLGSAVMALRQFGGRLVSPSRMVRQFYTAGALKWLAVGLCWFLGIAVWKLPFLPMLSGFVVALAVSIWTLNKA